MMSDMTRELTALREAATPEPWERNPELPYQVMMGSQDAAAFDNEAAARSNGCLARPRLLHNGIALHFRNGKCHIGGAGGGQEVGDGGRGSHTGGFRTLVNRNVTAFEIDTLGCRAGRKANSKEGEEQDTMIIQVCFTR